MTCVIHTLMICIRIRPQVYLTPSARSASMGRVSAILQRPRRTLLTPSGTSIMICMDHLPAVIFNDLLIVGTLGGLTRSL